MERAEYGLQRGGEDGSGGAAAGLVGAPAEAQQRAELERRRPAGERVVGDEGGPPRRQDAHRRAGVGGEEALGDDQSQRRVAQDRQRVLRGGRRMLGGVGGVGQRAEQERPVSEAMAQPALERLEVRGQPRYLRKASVALVPPKPKALDSAYSTSTLRAWFGM
jgi:hypothetical protein